MGFPIAGGYNDPGTSLTKVMKCVNKIKNKRKGSLETKFTKKNINILGRIEGNIYGSGKAPRNTF